MSAFSSAVEPKSSRPSEQAVSDQMNKWLEMVYEYFALEEAERGHTSNHQEVMARVTNYLDRIQAQLESQYGGAFADGVTGCGICQEAIVGGGRRFGLLKSCSHKFCERCVRTLLDRLQGSTTSTRTTGNGVQTSRSLMCPTCHHGSDQVVFTDAFHPGGSAEKTRLFESLVCLNSDHHLPVGIGFRRPTRAASALALRRLREGRR
ncbi:hypothetical protein TYRP_008865 [Tyrophagus putrescentiae]|nr:hypothetical protein TYRP_008865 [Tyrophagus putrescentiae]